MGSLWPRSLSGFQVSGEGREKAVVLDVRRHQSEREEREARRLGEQPFLPDQEEEFRKRKFLSTLGIEIGFYSLVTRPMSILVHWRYGSNLVLYQKLLAIVFSSHLFEINYTWLVIKQIKLV